MICPFDPARAIRILADHGVRFVVIGDLAAVFWTDVPVMPVLEICPDRASDLAGALNALDARPRDPREDDSTILRFETNAGPLDCIAAPRGTGGHDDLATRAREVEIDGVAFRVASLEDLIRMREAANTRIDHVVQEILSAAV